MKKIDRSEQNQDQDQNPRPATRKLQLHKETLRTLTSDQLRGVAGGTHSGSCIALACGHGGGGTQ